MHSFQALLIDMCINLRRRNVGVAEHLLNDAQIGAVAQQMRREAVPEQVWINILFQPSVPGFSLTICQIRAVVNFVPRSDKKISLPLRRLISFGRSVDK